jgi:basic membrane lipoprotein Med (substrate-binding protein (PBP1-ABC) superfamily)
MTVVITGVAACGKVEKKPAAFKVALLSPGPVSDAGWNAAAYEGLQRIERELGAAISQVQVGGPAEFEEHFRHYAAEGYNLVFGHGFEFQNAAAKVSPDFPKTIFITTSGSTVRQNVAPMIFELEEATYLMGMLTAMMSKSGRAGLVGGVEIPSVGSTFLAFEGGAHAVRPDFKVVTSYIGNWEDVGAAKEATLALIDQGADFILHNADAAGLGVFQAVQERKGKGVYAFGSNKDQNQIAPDVILASGVIDIPGAFVEVTRRVKEGTFKAEPMWLGMKEGVISLVYNPKLEGAIPADIRVKVDEVQKKILTGELTVPRGKF